MIRWLQCRRQHHPRGQALVETAIALPILLLLSLGTFDLGRGIAAHIALTEAVQEGSLFAAHEYGGFASKELGDAAVATRITTSSGSEPVAGATVTVACVAAPAPGTIRIQATYDLPVISPPAMAIFGGTFTLGVEVVATNFHQEGCP